MKGLIYKDFQNLLAYKNSLILFCLSFFLISITNNTMQGILPFMLVFLCTMSVMSTFSFDEQAKWNRFALTLPIQKKDLVRSKYCLYLLLSFVGLVVGFIVTMILASMTVKGFHLEETLGILLGTFVGLTIFASVQYPIIYKFGIEKARIYIFGFAFLFVGLIGGVAFLLEKFPIKLNLSIAIPKSVINVGGPILLLAIILLIFYLSYRISLHIFMKKEF